MFFRSKFFLLSLLVSIDGYGQLAALNNLQRKSNPNQIGNVDYNIQGQLSDDIAAASESLCEEDKQDSIPLKFFNLGLLRTVGDKLIASHNPNTGKLRLQSGLFVANCRDMLQWTVRRPNAKQPDYYVELKINKPAGCAFNNCKYQILTKNEGSKEMSFAPTYQGFLSCLEKTGVLTKNDQGEYITNEESEKNIVERELDVTLTGLDRTANLHFVSFGPEAQKMGPMYEKVKIDQCYYVEKISKHGERVYSKEDWSHHEQALEVQRLCQSDNYREIFDNVNKYTKFENELRRIGVKLIEEDVKELAKQISNAEAKEDLVGLNLRLINDFNENVIAPLINDIDDKFKKWMSLPAGEAKDKAHAELKQAREQLEAYKKAPYLTPSHLNKLKAYGHFGPAKNLHLTMVSIDQHKDVGKSFNGVRFTPSKAKANVRNLVAEYEKDEPRKQRDYEILSCERVGESGRVYSRANEYSNRVKRRSENYQNHVNQLAEQMQRECSKYYVNQNRCVTQFTEMINGLKLELRERNEMDRARAEKLISEGDRLAKLEEKAQNCDESIVAASSDEPALESNDVVPSGVFNFNYQAEADQAQAGGINQQQLMQQQMMMQQQQMMMQNQGGFSSNFGMSGGLNLGFGGAMGGMGGMNPMMMGGMGGMNPMMMGGMGMNPMMMGGMGMNPMMMGGMGMNPMMMGGGMFNNVAGGMPGSFNFNF
jgi:hypothetical protein